LIEDSGDVDNEVKKEGEDDEELWVLWYG
jgi:hypothetical protein